MRATARAEVAAEDGIPADDYYDRFRRTPAEDFYKKPVLCVAHVFCIADPVKYRKKLEAVQAIQRQQEDWTVRLKSDGPSYPEMYRKSYNSEELYYEELKLADVRAKFHADCAARNIRTTEDAERAWIRIAMARAEVVRPEI